MKNDGGSVAGEGRGIRSGLWIYLVDEPTDLLRD